VGKGQYTFQCNLSCSRRDKYVISPVLLKFGTYTDRNVERVPAGTELRNGMLSTIPLGRLATPADIANATCYLASDEATYITGLCMEVDGGRGI
jgi:NAD(P)-dependent dehydrogenase (short-subunit alcohol dehydrogenase family)